MNDVCIRYTALADNLTVRGFRTLTPESLVRFNADVGTSLGTHQLAYIRGVFERELRRDPTVGEVRLLAAMERGSAYHADRITARELISTSDDLASTWADAMDKHRRLKEGSTTPPMPATLTDILQIPEQLAALDPTYKPVVPSLSVLPGDACLAAVASGRLARMSLHSPHGDRLVCTALPPVRPAAKRVKEGDLLILAEHTDRSLLALRLSSLYDVTVTSLDDTSVMSAVLASCEGADLYAEVLTPTQGYLPYELLCADGRADCVLRVPSERLAAVRTALQDVGGRLVTFGRVRRDKRIVIHHLIPQPPVGDPPVAQPSKRQAVVDLPAKVLRGVTMVYGYAFHPASDIPMPSFDMPDAPCGDDVVFVPELGLSAAFSSANVAEAGRGFSLAARAVTEALSSLPSDATSPSLSVTVEGTCTPDVLFEAVCGLYRAAVETACPMPDARVRVDMSSAKVSLRISVCAWAAATAPSEDVQK
jgi:hypothetical protein